MQLAMDPEWERIDPSVVWAARHRLETDPKLLTKDAIAVYVNHGRPGVYVLWNPDRTPSGASFLRCDYVGKSDNNIPGRLRKHLRNAENKKLHSNLHYNRGMTKFSFEYTVDRETARELEKALIQIMQPVCNVQKPR